LIRIDVDGHGDFLREWEAIQHVTQETAQPEDCPAPKQNVETVLAL
jgi:hypothetical protein